MAKALLKADLATVSSCSRWLCRHDKGRNYWSSESHQNGFGRCCKVTIRDHSCFFLLLICENLVDPMTISKRHLIITCYAVYLHCWLQRRRLLLNFPRTRRKLPQALAWTWVIRTSSRIMTTPDSNFLIQIIVSSWITQTRRKFNP